MSGIYRVRPANDYTIDELKNSYLWFSRPIGFKGDVNDANIGAFITDTDAIKRGIDYCIPDFPYKSWYERMGHTGICCFTSEMPDSKTIKKFPKCTKSQCLCIEYNKEMLEEFFLNHKSYPIYPCFNPVVYDTNPTKLETCDDWSILWQKDENGSLYKTIPGILYEHPRECDTFMRMLLTRISSKFSVQKEERIILGGCNIPSHDNDLLGYSIPIPENAINKIAIYPNVEEDYIDQLKEITSIKNKIVLLKKNRA